ncbi:hypothetical protein FRB99_002248 [Tulasnella sp. 403]|nr:hypothetical protein FRB99_002248 [Tulasnella sp. 403]
MNSRRLRSRSASEHLPVHHQHRPGSRSPSPAVATVKFLARPKRRSAVPILVIVFVWFLIWLWRWHHWFLNFLTYSFRPLYDQPTIPHNIITHLHSPGVPQNDKAACQRHGWDLWQGPSGRRSKVVDAVIFSIEVDLLEVRLAELSPLVSHFLILESTSTFTGLPKPLVLEPLLQPNTTDTRFIPYLDKIRYRSVEGRQLQTGEDPFNIEKEMRQAMTAWLASPESNVEEGDLIVMSDVDEIPSLPALTLLSTCAAPSPIHLAMSQHMYDFDRSLSPLPPAWRARAVRFQPDQTPYVHSMNGHPSGSEAFMLSDAGWHCSFCFKYIGDFVFKARGFSHTDRLGPPSMARKLLEPETIKRTVCEGKDFFGMLPEAYDWSSLLARWGGSGRREHGILPAELVRHGTGRWKWLVGGTDVTCSRRWEMGEDWKFGAEPC